MERDRPAERKTLRREPEAEKQRVRKPTDDVPDEPVVQAREDAEEDSLEEERRAVDDAYAREAQDHRESIEGDKKLGTPPPFPVDPVKGENTGAPSR